MRIAMDLRKVYFWQMTQFGLKGKLNLAINYLFLFFDEWTNIIMISLHLLFILSL